MEPTLYEGDFVLTKPLAPTHTLTQGELVVLKHPDEAGLQIVKRVGACEDGQIWLSSDNESHGTDSRTWGAVSASTVHSTVTLVLNQGAQP